MNERKIPKIRFKGFSDDWEQRKLSGLCENITVGIANSATHAYTDDGIVMFRNQNIKENYLDDSDVIFIDEEFEKKYVNKRLKANDLLVARTGYPGTACVVPEKYEGSQTFTTLIARLKEGTNPFYACQYINSDYGKKYFLATQIGGGQKNSGAGILEDFPMILPPTIEEQERIANFLKHFDNLITLHQRKLDKLRIVKKSMLEKCFPKNGEKVPQIRIGGFTDDWEQRKLGEVFEEYSEKNHEELPALTIIQGGGTILREESDRALQYDKSSLSNYKMVRKDDFIVHLRSFEGGLEKANTDGIISPAYHTFHGDNTDSRFYYPFFRSRRFIDVLLKPHVYGIRDGKSIDIEGMKSIMIPVPSYNEQKAIGGYIETLDNLITLHQRKLDKLRIVKKSVLADMFV
ncbi:restriction endonuclease subunit S [Oribacterium sp. FC2011]|uniref:restriction endonuclease subunit S n=1 Tax=Oribacterium sp. FC2011 TaxID=1408311 RepID=UPI000678DF93|nr:restriction endonuclease subunit S [Oribacterium sp. FC2011]